MLNDYVLVSISIKITRTNLDSEIWSKNLLAFYKGKNPLLFVICTVNIS